MEKQKRYLYWWEPHFYRLDVAYSLRGAVQGHADLYANISKEAQDTIMSEGRGRVHKD